jgi:hypothetical protein
LNWINTIERADTNLRIERKNENINKQKKVDKYYRKHKLPTNSISRDKDTFWVIFTTLLSFVLASSLLYISDIILETAGTLIAGILVVIIIYIGILFDIIGTAVATANEIPFHAMASKKLETAKNSIKLIRNANRVSNFCNDIIGDVCGIISGAASTIIVIKISGTNTIGTTTIAGLVIGGLVVALTVGGKAFGKTIALKHSNTIVHKVSGVMNFLKM